MKTTLLIITLLISIAVIAQDKKPVNIIEIQGKLFKLVHVEEREVFGTKIRDKFYKECDTKGQIKENPETKTIICRLRKKLEFIKV